MRKILAIISVILVLSMLPFSLFGCGSKKSKNPQSSQSDTSSTQTPDESESQSDEESEQTEKDGPQTIKLASSTDKLKLLGRTYKVNGGLACDHTATGIEFKGNFQGDVKIKIKSSAIGAGTTESYFTVYVDGVRQSERFAVRGTSTIKLASFDKKGEHTIKIVKQTESNYTLAELIELTYDGELLAPPAQKDYYLEFIGDSLTCGMGNLPDEDGDYPQAPAVAQTSPYEDGTQSYGYIAADILDADVNIISEAGIGLSATWFDPMPDFYEAASYNRSKTAMYDFKSARVPDVVVINLGTNDYFISKELTHPQNSQATAANLKDKAKDLIELVRSSYGENMPIIWVSKFVNIDNIEFIDAMDDAISELDGDDAGLYRLDVTPNMDGAQGHPTVAGHQTAANELVDFIKEKEMISSTVNLAKDADKVKHLGRTQVLLTGIACDHTATGIEFSGTFNGKVKIKINSTSNNAPDGKQGYSSYFTVYVDGERQSQRFEVPDDGTPHVLTLADFYDKGDHTIKVVKQTESNYTLTDLMELTFLGSLADAPAQKELYLEFIGDSLTCGMGNLPKSGGGYEQDSNLAQTSPYEDGTQSYGYIAAEMLDADVNIVSEAGIGLSATWFDPMPDFYKAASYKRSTTAMYDFKSARVPDVVVINLGTNDYFISKELTHPQNSQATAANLKDKAKDLIELVRSSYGENMPIIWVSKFVNIDNIEFINAMDAAISELGGDDAGLYRLDVTPNMGGAQGHPTVAGHETAAKELVDFMKLKGLVPN